MGRGREFSSIAGCFLLSEYGLFVFHALFGMSHIRFPIELSVAHLGLYALVRRCLSMLGIRPSFFVFAIVNAQAFHFLLAHTISWLYHFLGDQPSVFFTSLMFRDRGGKRLALFFNDLDGRGTKLAC